MKFLRTLATASLLVTMLCCGSASTPSQANEDPPPGAPVADASVVSPTAPDAAAPSADASTGPTSCPTGTTAATMNGLAVCKTASGLPLVEHVFVIVLENMSLDTFGEGTTPNLDKLRADHAIATDYHGAAHPSLPNYIAMTSGDTQGIGCDCNPTGAACTSCNLLSHNCGCSRDVENLADQIEKAKLDWKAYGEGMGTPCNLKDDPDTEYAVRHVPFLYYEGIQKDEARCKSHVVDLSGSGLALGADAPAFQFIAPNLTDDGHDPFSIGNHDTNLANIDAFIGPLVQSITDSQAYAKGGLVLIVYDEDDNSGFPSPDDPIPLLVLSPYAKKQYESNVKADHYTLLATMEDALGLGGRLGRAGKPRKGMADTLADFFPVN